MVCTANVYMLCIQSNIPYIKVTDNSCAQNYVHFSNIHASARSSKIVASSRLERLLCSAKLPEAKDDTHRLSSGCQSTGR